MMRRCVRCAIAGSCVTRMIVWPFAASSSKEADDVAAGLLIEVAGGLVGQNQRGRIHQRAGDGDALPLAAGELARAVLRAVGEADALERLEGALAALVGVHARVEKRQLDVLPDRRARQEVEGLEDEAELLIADARQCLRGHRGHVFAVEPVAALRRRVEAAEDVHQGGLAGAGRADDRDELAAIDPHVHAAQRLHRVLAGVVHLAHALQLDEGLVGLQRRGRLGLGVPPVFEFEDGAHG